jgi:formamidopyrimidine-DNA glycosylase
MPELPEVETVVSELRPKLKNKRIKEVRVLMAKMVAVGPHTLPNLRKTHESVPLEFAKTLKGKTITNVARRAKMIIIDLARLPSPAAQAAGGQAGKFAVLVHLKMTGQLIFFGKKELDKQIRLFNIPRYEPVHLPAKSTHVIIEFTDGSKLFYNDFRQFGYLKLVTDKELPQVKELQNFGPEPLEKEFTLEVFRNILKRRPKAVLKPFLLDSNMIAGIGNIYSDEIAFYAKVKPTRIIKTLKPGEIKLLYKGIKKVLADAVKHRGSSVGDFIRPGGDWGTYGKIHRVYGRAGEKCYVCGTMIKSQKFNGRTGSFCPKCQK